MNIVSIGSGYTLPLRTTGPLRCTVPAAQSAAAAELDPEFRMALARTRQATAIHRAIGFLNTSSRAR
jgi:hypothetical protein